MTHTAHVHGFTPACPATLRPVPHFLDGLDLSPNRIELARLARELASYIDLTSTNPTREGLLFPPDVLRAASDGYWDARRYAPDAHGDLAAREAICAYYAARGLCVRPEQLFLTASTSEAYNMLFGLLCSPGDNVLAPEIGYPLFDVFAGLNAIDLKPYRMRSSVLGWRLDWEDVHAACDDRTRAALLVTPHNPTGAVLRKLDSHWHLPVIIDEVFAEFARPHAPLPALDGPMPVFTLNGISKMFALPDLKLGWVLMNDAALEKYGERFALINDTFLGANALSQHMLPALLRDGMPFVRAMTARVDENLAMAVAALSALPQVECLLPEGGYLLLPSVDTVLSDEALVLHLLEHGVFVHPGHFYNHVGTPPRIMISCLTEPQKLRRGVARLCQVVEDVHDRRFHHLPPAPRGAVGEIGDRGHLPTPDTTAQLRAAAAPARSRRKS